MKGLYMTHKQVTVPAEDIDNLLGAIEDKLQKIGKTYRANGKCWHDDLVITGLRKVAAQLGTDFEILSSNEPDGFIITRVPHAAAE